MPTEPTEPKAVFQPDFSAELTPPEIAFLREQLQGGVLRKAFSISARQMPSSFLGGVVDDHYQTRCVARLNQLNGWVLHEAALLSLIAERPPKAERPVESYPDSAKVDSGWGDAVVSKRRIKKTFPKQPKSE